MAVRLQSAILVLFTSLLLPSLALAEPVVRCTHRDDRPDLGSPVHRKKGGRSLQHRLPNGHGVTILKKSGNWARIRYADPGPPVRSEPLSFNGWISNRYLKACPVEERIGMDAAWSGGVRIGPKKGGLKLRRSNYPLKLCWWNAKRLGHGKSRDWKATARAVRGCDVVGLGEVMTKVAPAKLASMMGSGWKAATSSKAVGRKGYREWYGVIFDAERVQFEDGTKGFHPDEEDHFAREPWAVTMKAGNFDFTLVLLHVTWGDSAAERVAELEHVDDAYRLFQDHDAEEQDVIIAGDFNRTPTQRGWGQIAKLGLRLLIKGVRTTINSKGRGANLYDQIIIDPRHTKEWTGKAGAISPGGKKAVTYRKTVSDHVPVWATFEVDGEDDD